MKSSKNSRTPQTEAHFSLRILEIRKLIGAVEKDGNNVFVSYKAGTDTALPRFESNFAALITRNIRFGWRITGRDAKIIIPLDQPLGAKITSDLAWNGVDAVTIRAPGLAARKASENIFVQAAFPILRRHKMENATPFRDMVKVGSLYSIKKSGDELIVTPIDKPSKSRVSSAEHSPLSLEQVRGMGSMSASAPN